MRLDRLLIVPLLAAACLVPSVASPQRAARKPDVFFMPTPPRVVDAMLAMAKVLGTDVIYDLGSGDGRIPIAAAKQFGARGVGIDIDPALTAEASANARQAGVDARVQFRTEDLFEADISAATVVTLFLTPSLNISLLPKLNRELKPGTRIVSHRWEMKDVSGYEYQPDQKQLVEGSNVYVWTIPILRK